MRAELTELEVAPIGWPHAGTGDIAAAYAVSHCVHPEGRDLWSRGAYHVDRVTAENWQRTDRDCYARRRVSGYLAAAG